MLSMIKTTLKHNNFIRYHIVPTQDKVLCLVSFLLRHKSCKIIVYFLTCAFVDYISRALPSLLEMAQQQQQQQQPSKKKPKAAALDSPTLLPLPTLLSLHGKMAQKRREKTYESFVTAPTAVLLCTDVAGPSACQIAANHTGR
jgi:ATP-dependent RNA helicase DDX55/SPB4